MKENDEIISPAEFLGLRMCVVLRKAHLCSELLLSMLESFLCDDTVNGQYGGV